MDKPDKETCKKIIRKCFRYQFLLILILIIKILFILPVSAESGTLTIDVRTTSTYAPSRDATPSETPVWTSIYVDSSDYTNIQFMQMGGTDLVFANAARSTTFTITSGGSGSGTVTYNKAGGFVYWIFDGSNGATITSSPLVLSYADPTLFNDITSSTAPFWQAATIAASSTQPAFIHLTGGKSITNNNAAAQLTYQTDTSATFSNNYNVNYSITGLGLLATVNIDKSITSVNSKVNISNSTALKFFEQTFNHVSYNYSFLYDTGIALNMTDASGDYDFLVVNSTGYTGPGAPVPTPTPTPTIPPNSDGVITFDKSAYSVGDKVNLSWAISDNAWVGCFGFCTNPFGIKIFLNDVEQTDLDAALTGLTIQDGTYPFVAQKQGRLRADLEEGLIFTTVVDSTTATVGLRTQPFILINGTVPTKTPVNITYDFGFLGITFSDVIETLFLNPATGLYQIENTYNVVNSSGVKTIQFNNIGTYQVKLTDVDTNTDYAIAVTRSFFIIPTINNTITNNTINIDKSTYSYGDVIQGNYTVSNVNYSQGITYIDVFNVDQGIITAQFFGKGVTWADTSQQMGNVYIKIQNLEAGLGLPAINFFNGNNKIRLMLNSNGTLIELANQTFVLQFIDSAGYGLKLSKYTVAQSEAFDIIYQAPAQSQIRVVYANTSEIISNYTVLGNSSISTSLSRAGIYYIQLIDSTGVIHQPQILTVLFTPTPTPTPITGGQAATDVSNLLSSNIFWAFILTFGMMAAVAALMKGVNAEIPVAITGVLGLAAFSTINWLPWWLTFSVIILIFVVFAWQQAGRLNVGTNK